MFVQFKRLTWKASLLTIIISILAFTIALAASGDLDPTFDGDGLVTSYASEPWKSDLAQSIAIQANGKIVAAGISNYGYATSNFAILRYNTDGSLDTAFGGDGRVLTNLGNNDGANDVAIQSNGKIVAAGRTCLGYYCDVALARYNAGGSLDTTFSGDGKQITDFGSTDNGSDGGLAIQPDGKIVVGGYVHNGTDRDFAVYRYNANGSLDTTFSGDGMLKFGFGAGRWDTAFDLALQSDGKIIVIGETYNPNSGFLDRNFALARLNTDGSLDVTFSGDGRQTTNFGNDDRAYGVTLQMDGKAVVVGMKSNGDLRFFALARYNVDGSLDTTFNGTGRKVFSIIAGTSSSAEDVIVQSNQMIVVAGSAVNSPEGGSFDFAMVRLNPDGALDTTFGEDGKVIIDFGGTDFAASLAVRPADGKYVLGGYAYGDLSEDHFALARVLP